MIISTCSCPRNRQKFWTRACLSLGVSGVGLLVTLFLGISVGSYSALAYSRLSSAEKLSHQFNAHEATAYYMLYSQPFGVVLMLVLYEVILAWCYASHSKKAARRAETMMKQKSVARGTTMKQDYVKPVHEEEETTLLLKTFSPEHEGNLLEDGQSTFLSEDGQSHLASTGYGGGDSAETATEIATDML